VLPLWQALLVVAGSVLAFMAAGVIAGLMVALTLDERDRRRTGHLPRCPGLRGWDCTCPPP
jgi:hypothetical protein